jgi:prepilin-type N-terminal cleavage/methylation domain-containing protein
VQLDQDIKGFTILELLVVISIVAIISGVAYPNFSKWKTDREVRAATEKIAGMISNVATQTQRGNFSYSQFRLLPVKGKPPVFFSKGMKKNTFTTLVNSGATPTCKLVQNGHWDDLNGQSLIVNGSKYEDYYEVFDPGGNIDELNIGTHIGIDSAICFGTNGSYYKAINSLSKASNTNVKLDGVDTPNHIILCTLKNAEANGGKCPKSGTKLEKPAYLVKWSRFGNVSKYKWNGSGWNRQ